MNHNGRSLIAGLLLGTLVACSSGAPPQDQPLPDASLFTPANAWQGAVPAGAAVLTPGDFRARVASGELVLTSSASVLANAAARAQQYQDDLTLLHTVPSPSAELTALLAQAALPGDVSDRPVKLANSQTVLLFGLDAQVRNAAEAYRNGQSPDNALADYTQTYDLLPGDLQTQAPTPASLRGRPLEALRTALTGLNTLLKLRPASLGAAHLEPVGGAALRSQGLNAGNGTDNDGPCAPTNLVKRYWFPLKNFVSPVKNQASRGTCWAFSAIGALESREQVRNNNPADLSEQFLVNKVKQDWDSSDYTDGYWPDQALNTALSKGQVFPSEGSWTYNGATNRPSVTDGDSGSYAGSCAGYSGMCSDTAHQSGESCTSVILTFCGYVKVAYGGAGVAASSTTQVWDGRQNFDLERYRLLLAGGHVLIATFQVYRGFMDDVKADGVVSNYSQTRYDKGKEVNGSYGGHAVQIVGFLSNDDLASFGASANIGGGGYFIVKNSWGCKAGDGGYYYLPADYVSRLFDTLSTLVFDTRRSDAWNREQAAPGGTDAPAIEIKADPGRVDLRVETDLAQFFSVTHPVARSVDLTVTSDQDGQLYAGPWNTDQALFFSSLKVTFAAPGLRRLHLLAKYGTSQAVGTLNVNAVNTPPTLRLTSSGSPLQGEPYSVTALIRDLNEPDGRSLCANAVWSVDAPDTLANPAGCSQVVTFGTTGLRQIRVSTHDSEGAAAFVTLALEVLPPPVNPYPRLLTAGVSSLEYVLVNGGPLRFCGSPAVTDGAAINLTEGGCSPGIGTPPPPQRYFAQVKVENPVQEALSYDWNLYVTRGSELLLYSANNSASPIFRLHDYGNEGLLTSDCRVTLSVHAPDPARSKGPVTVWTGKCTYHAYILK